jgi:hypothetical protein
VIAHAESVRVAGELREILRRSRAARPHLWRASQAGSPDGRDPLLRMARVHAPGRDRKGLCSFHRDVAFGLIER